MLLPYLAETLSTFLPEGEPAPEAYRLARHVLDAVAGGVGVTVAARYAETWVLRLSGLLPEAGACDTCGEPLAAGAVVLDLEPGGFSCPRCASPSRLAVGPEAIALLDLFRTKPLPEAARAIPAPAGSALAGVEAVAREVRRRFLGHELRSYRFLGVLG